MRKLQTYLVSALVSAGLMLVSVMPAAAQNRGRNENYYSGMHQSVQKGDYARYSRDDEQRHHHESGGIGPGKAAAIGGAGGAVLGAVFGGGLKGTLIGGAAGAGIGAIVGKATQGNDHNKNGRNGHR
jgi:hypothetical protein